MSWIDITTPLVAGLPVYPGDQPLRRELALALDRGEGTDVTALSMSAHAGTHVDAPAHVIAGGAGVESLDPAAMIGPCTVVPVGAGAIAVADLAAAVAPGCERILLRTGHGLEWPPVGGEALTAAAAAWLVARGVRLVGIDTMSVAGGEEAIAVHRTLLEAGIVLLEGLDLRAAPPGSYHLTCLPLLLPGADGSPARALLEDRAGG